MKKQSLPDIDDLVASGLALVRRAEEAIEESERFYAENGLDPRDALEFVRKHAGEAAVEHIEETVRKTIEQLERDLAFTREPPAVRKPGQRVRVRNMV